jgi:hypothetical protein
MVLVHMGLPFPSGNLGGFRGYFYSHNMHGNPVGRGHTNPIFDTIIYLVEFPDGHMQEFSANIITQNLYSQLDAEGNQFLLFDEIVDYKMLDDAVKEENKFQNLQNGNLHPAIPLRDGSSALNGRTGPCHGSPLQI